MRNESDAELLLLDLLKHAEGVVDLIYAMAQSFKKIGTVGNPNALDASLVITPVKKAQLDAEEFWRVCFGPWAK